MASYLNDIKRTNLFIKSSVDDFQDPVFLTFRIDFFPPEEQYPKFDGLRNSNLLINSNRDSSFATGINQTVEYSTQDWLSDYYPANSFINEEKHPAEALLLFKTRLKEVQDAPWYFQSIQGIGDLWKGMHRVKEGNQKTTITINCIDSIRQPLTEIAENYRYAMYDQERLAYRVPDNMRWFDMVIDLVEIRDIADKSGQFFKYGSNGQLEKGLKVIQFRCKMCEFDFSGFMGGSQSDHRIATEEKPFSPSFNINIGWVIQEQVQLSDANSFRHMGMFAGVLDAMNSKITRFMQSAIRLPGAIIGSVLNELQTAVETKVLGNAYSGVNDFLTDMNNISGNLTGRNPVVGPPPTSNLGEEIYPPLQRPTEIKDLGDVYP
jgi:hypothetical protein